MNPLFFSKSVQWYAFFASPKDPLLFSPHLAQCFVVINSLFLLIYYFNLLYE